MIADASQMLYISTISCLFSPRRGFAPGLAPERQSESKDTLSLHSEKITQRRFYTQKPLHREGFTQSSFYTDAFAHRRFYIQKLLHRKALSPQKAFKQSSFTHRRFSTKKFLHTGTLTRRCPSFYTQELLHTHALQKEAFRHRNFYSLFTRKLLHRSFCTEMPLHTEAFTHRSFYTEKILHREAFSQTSVCGKEL